MPKSIPPVSREMSAQSNAQRSQASATTSSQDLEVFLESVVPPECRRSRAGTIVEASAVAPFLGRVLSPSQLVGLATNSATPVAGK